MYDENGETIAKTIGVMGERPLPQTTECLSQEGKPTAAATMIQRTSQLAIWKKGKTRVATCMSSHALAA